MLLPDSPRSSGGRCFWTAWPQTCRDFWLPHCLPMLTAADRVHVLCLDGYRESEGVTWELEVADRAGKPIHFIDSEMYEQQAEYLAAVEGRITK